MDITSKNLEISKDTHLCRKVQINIYTTKRGPEFRAWISLGNQGSLPGGSEDWDGPWRMDRDWLVRSPGKEREPWAPKSSRSAGARNDRAAQASELWCYRQDGDMHLWQQHPAGDRQLEWSSGSNSSWGLESWVPGSCRWLETACLLQKGPASQGQPFSTIHPWKGPSREKGTKFCSNPKLQMYLISSQ